MMATTHVGFLSFGSFLPLPSRISFSKRRTFAMAALSDDPIREWILSEGKATHITKICPVGGGCINLASRYGTDAGSFFVKTNRSIGPSMFEGEALGLGAMYETRTIRVPRPFKVGALPTGGSYIIMEFIEFGSSRGNQSVFGKKLAEMHKAGKSGKGFGFDVDNTIGRYGPYAHEHRLGYQLKLALDQYGDSTIYQRGHRLMKNLAPLFEGVNVEPCLLHGDLWSGNISSDKNGEPVILDPACYYGHNEAEFGMSWCAGFGGSFYNSYFEAEPLFVYATSRPELYSCHNPITAQIRGGRIKENKILERMNMNADESKTEALPPVTDTELILSLERATLMAKQLPATTDPTHRMQIYSYLQQANRNLSSFLSNTQLPTQATENENSLSSSATRGDGDCDPMEVGDHEEEDNSKTTIDRIEERMRNCFIKNKRAKRPLSPSSMAAAEENRLYEDGFLGGSNAYGFDPNGTKLRALDLVYQFHG
ncbi:protein-ribulosamine 3-kinase [Citrus sinensis]|uniref:Protein-ribulosamine 3-kinase n=1 Tax=Citrus sinensis TaxID=2711 RepID=A0ACB8MR30_CITSI|nr:protein-ribulosamine 3-kinase [Citrus sinensis]